MPQVFPDPVDVELNGEDATVVLLQLGECSIQVMSHGGMPRILNNTSGSTMWMILKLNCIDSRELESIGINEALSPIQHLFAESAAGGSDGDPLHVPEVRIDMPRILNNTSGSTRWMILKLNCIDSRELESIQGINEALSPIQHLFAESAAGGSDGDPLHVPEVRIDMPRILNNGESVYPVVYQDQWKRYIDHLKNSKPDEIKYDSMKIMFGTLNMIAGTVIGGLATNRLSISSTAPALGSTAPALVVELASLLGLSVAMAGMILRGKRKRQVASALMIKIGAMVIAAAIIFSMVQHLPQGIAWIVSVIAFPIMVVAAASA